MPAAPRSPYRRRRIALRTAALIIESVPIKAIIGVELAVCGRRVRVVAVVALDCCVCAIVVGGCVPDVATGVGDAGIWMLDATTSPGCEVPATVVAAGFSSTVTAVSVPDEETRARSAVFISSVVSF